VGRIGGGGESGLTSVRWAGNFAPPMAKTIPSPGETLAQRFFIDANVFAEETEKNFARDGYSWNAPRCWKMSVILFPRISRAKD
jgi:hypothetical protein